MVDAALSKVTQPTCVARAARSHRSVGGGSIAKPQGRARRILPRIFTCRRDSNATRRREVIHFGKPHREDSATVASTRHHRRGARSRETLTIRVAATKFRQSIPARLVAPSGTMGVR